MINHIFLLDSLYQLFLIALRRLQSYASQRMDLVLFIWEDDGDMGRDQRPVENTLEFKMSSLEITIRDWLTNRAERWHIHLRRRGIYMRFFKVLRTTSYRVRATTTTPSRSIPTPLANYIEERREDQKINRTSIDSNWKLEGLSQRMRYAHREGLRSRWEPLTRERTLCLTAGTLSFETPHPGRQWSGTELSSISRDLLATQNLCKAKLRAKGLNTNHERNELGCHDYNIPYFSLNITHHKCRDTTISTAIKSISLAWGKVMGSSVVLQLAVPALTIWHVCNLIHLCHPDPEIITFIN